MAEHGADWVHPFEVAGLGKAPFRVVGFAHKTYQACPECPVQPGNSCDYCGQGIMNVVYVKGHDGSEFKVGIDCAERTGDTKIIEQQRKLFRQYERERVAEAKKEHRTGLVATVETRLGDLLARLDAQAARKTWGASIAADMANRLRVGSAEDLTPKQLALLERIERVDEDVTDRPDPRQAPQPKSESEYLGKVGDKIESAFTIEAIINLPSRFSAYGDLLYILRDDAGNRAVWKTSGSLKLPGGKLLVYGKRRDTRGVLRRGERFRAAATIKKRSEYKGERQTDLTRLKALEILDWVNEAGYPIEVRLVGDEYLEREAAEQSPKLLVEWNKAGQPVTKRASAKKASTKAKSPKKPTPRRASPKRLLITDPDALAKLAIVEGNSWADRQRKGGVKLDNGFFLNKRAYELKVEQGLGGTDIPLAELDPAAGVIVGENGWRTYIVMPDGEIMFDGASTTNDFFRDSAASFMQVI